MLMAQFAAFAQHTWPHRVLKIIQGANCPVVAPSGVLLSRAGPQVSHRKMVLGSIVRGKAGVRATCTPSQEGRAAEERSAGARSSALATLPKQLPPGLELPPLCKQPRPPPPAPGFDGADRAGRKTERAEKATYGDMGGFAG